MSETERKRRDDYNLNGDILDIIAMPTLRCSNIGGMSSYRKMVEESLRQMKEKVIAPIHETQERASTNIHVNLKEYQSLKYTHDRMQQAKLRSYSFASDSSALRLPTIQSNSSQVYTNPVHLQQRQQRQQLRSHSNSKNSINNSNSQASHARISTLEPKNDHSFDAKAGETLFNQEQQQHSRQNSFKILFNKFNHNKHINIHERLDEINARQSTVSTTLLNSQENSPERAALVPVFQTELPHQKSVRKLHFEQRKSSQQRQKNEHRSKDNDRSQFVAASRQVLSNNSCILKTDRSEMEFVSNQLQPKLKLLQKITSARDSRGKGASSLLRSPQKQKQKQSEILPSSLHMMHGQ